MAARNIGEVADEVLAIALKIKKKEAEIEDLKEQKDLKTAELKTLADAEGLTSGGGKKSKFTIAPETVPHISDWDQFTSFIKQNDYFHLLQRRPGTKACQELWNLGTAIPGVDKFTQVKVNVKGV